VRTALVKAGAAQALKSKRNNNKKGCQHGPAFFHTIAPFSTVSVWNVKEVMVNFILLSRIALD